MSEAPPPLRVVRVHVQGLERPALAHVTNPDRAAEIVRDFQVGTTRVLSIDGAHFDRRHVTHLTVSTP